MYIIIFCKVNFQIYIFQTAYTKGRSSSDLIIIIIMLCDFLVKTGKHSHISHRKEKILKKKFGSNSLKGSA